MRKQHYTSSEDSHNELSDGSTDVESATYRAKADAVEEESGSSANRCLLGSVLFFIAVSIILAALFALNVIDNEDLKGIPFVEDIDFEGFFDNDPYGGLVSPENPEDAYRWYTPDQAGLELTVLNALSDDWQGEFESAMADWDGGAPDTMTLSTRKIAYDAGECLGETGLLKVCNANYGETDWRGLNVLLLDFDREFIHSSSAKMNEFFLAKASNAQRQYTMCHELGHGFGLPHWDIDFYNRNLGNCMDYTSRPRSNMRPDRSTFEFLKQLYGEVGATLAPSENSLLPEGTNQFGPPLPPPPRDPKKDKKEKDEEDRKLQQGPAGMDKKSRPQIPEHVMEVYQMAIRDEEISEEHYTFRHRQMMEEEEHGDAEIIYIEDGLGLMIYKLKA